MLGHDPSMWRFPGLFQLLRFDLGSTSVCIVGKGPDGSSRMLVPLV